MLAEAIGCSSDAIDVVDLDQSSYLLQRCIAEKGIPLFEREPGLFSSFCSRSIRQWADWQRREQKLQRERGDEAMPPLELAVLERKLDHLRERLELLRAESSASLEAFLLDRRQQLLVERLLHLSVEAASELLEHLLVQAFNQRPQTYAETFQQAGAMGLIPTELANRLVPAAGLRNRLVHDYEAIDPRRVHAEIGMALRDLEELRATLAARVAM